MKNLRFASAFAALAVLAAVSACSSTNEGTKGGVGVGDAGSGPLGAGAGADGAAGDGGCPAAQMCAGQCCGTGFVCVQDGSGNSSCALACTTSGICPQGAGCCDPGPLGGRAAGGVCMPATGQTCLCQKSFDCTSRACAPAIDASGHAVGPYVCVPNDGSPYKGCFGLTQCGATDCCVTDKNGNQFCAPPCTDDSTCGAATSHCDAFDFSASQCSGMTKACGL